MTQLVWRFGLREQVALLRRGSLDGGQELQSGDVFCPGIPFWVWESTARWAFRARRPLHTAPEQQQQPCEELVSTSIRLYLFIRRLQCVPHSQGAPVSWWFLWKNLTVSNYETQLDEKASSFQNKESVAALIKSADQSWFSFPGVKFLFSCLFALHLCVLTVWDRAVMSVVPVRSQTDWRSSSIKLRESCCNRQTCWRRDVQWRSVFSPNVELWNASIYTEIAFEAAGV